MMPAGHLPILLSLSALLLSPLLTGSLALCKSKLRWNLSLRVKFKSQVCQNSRIDSFFLELRVSTMQMLTLTQYWLIQWLRVAIFGSTWHIIAIPIMAKSVVKGNHFGSRSTFYHCRPNIGWFNGRGRPFLVNIDLFSLHVQYWLI